MMSGSCTAIGISLVDDASGNGPRSRRRDQRRLWGMGCRGGGQAEWPVSVQLADPRRDPREWARCAETRHKPGDNRCAALDLQWPAGVTASASASRARRLSQAHPITETRRGELPADVLNRLLLIACRPPRPAKPSEDRSPTRRGRRHPTDTRNVNEQVKTAVKQVCGKKAGGSENPVAVILRHRRRMAQSSEWRNPLCFSALRLRA